MSRQNNGDCLVVALGEEWGIDLQIGYLGGLAEGGECWLVRSGTYERAY